MELNEKDLENVLGGANPRVISKEQTTNDQLDESQLENVQAGIYNNKLAEELAKQNSNLYRKEMIQKLKDERDYIIQEENHKIK